MQEGDLQLVLGKLGELSKESIFHGKKTARKNAEPLTEEQWALLAAVEAKRVRKGWTESRLGDYLRTGYRTYDKWMQGQPLAKAAVDRLNKEGKAWVEEAE